MTKLFSKNRIQTQRKLTNKKNANSQKNLAVFLAGTKKNRVILNTTQKRPKKKKKTKLSSLGQEPIFNNTECTQKMQMEWQTVLILIRLLLIWVCTVCSDLSVLFLQSLTKILVKLNDMHRDNFHIDNS